MRIASVPELQLLFERYGDASVSERGETLLHLVTEQQFSRGLELLLGNGFPANVVDSDGETPLFYACRFDLLWAARMLIHHGANVHAQDHIGNTSLHVAALMDSLDCLECLIRAGADVNARNGNGIYPLMFGICHSGIRESLVAAGAVTEIMNNHGESLLQYAHSCDDDDVIDWLLTIRKK